jgi:hypothetical protein
MYSYDRRKTASFQDRFNGSFECVVWINDFTLEKNKSVTVSGTLSIISGNDSADVKFSDVTFKKKGKTWTISDYAEPVAGLMLGALIAQDGKTSQELDRISKMK